MGILHHLDLVQRGGLVARLMCTLIEIPHPGSVPRAPPLSEVPNHVCGPPKDPYSTRLVTQCYKARDHTIPYVFVFFVLVVDNNRDPPRHREIGDDNGRAVAHPFEHHTELVGFSRDNRFGLWRACSVGRQKKVAWMDATFRIVYPGPKGRISHCWCRLDS